MNITWYGHSTFGIEVDGVKLVVDPFLKPNNPVAPVTAAQLDAALAALQDFDARLLVIALVDGQPAGEDVALETDRRAGRIRPTEGAAVPHLLRRPVDDCDRPQRSVDCHMRRAAGGRRDELVVCPRGDAGGPDIGAGHQVTLVYSLRGDPDDDADLLGLLRRPACRQAALQGMERLGHRVHDDGLAAQGRGNRRCVQPGNVHILGYVRLQSWDGEGVHPVLGSAASNAVQRRDNGDETQEGQGQQIGRASCRERV